MAGGDKRGGGLTMEQRLELTRANAERRFHGDPASLRQVHTKTVTETPAVHVYVDTCDGRVPGMLVQWQQRADGWWGQTWFPARDGDAWVTVIEWVPADQLGQADQAWS